MKPKFLLVLAATLACVPLAATTAGAPAFWISVTEEGAYRVTHEDLAGVGDLGAVDSSRLALTHRGAPVPIWIEDGGDGTFGPGDSFEFLGTHLEGDVSHYSEHSRFNTYRLSVADTPAKRMAPAEAGRHEQRLPPASLIKSDHLENDEVMVRFSQRPDEPDTEVWFWKRLSFLDEQPFELPLDTLGLAPGVSRFRVQMRGWSSHRLPRDSEQRQHRAEIAVNDRMLAAGDWDGQDFSTIEGEVPAGVLTGESDRLKIVVPRRVPGTETDPMVDLSLLNWIELDYPHDGVVRQGQTRLRVEGSGARRVTLEAPGANEMVAFDPTGRRWSSRAADGARWVEAAFERADAAVVAVRDGAFLRPAGIAVDRPSSWRSADHRADYLMIAHPTLLAGTERLAEFHRSRGLEVAVIDVQDVYDEFNHGIVHPRAIRALISHAYQNWARPAPRFVLLVGDSSWDVHRTEHSDENYADWSYQPREGTREGFLKNRSTPYATGPDDRGLIPTGSFKGAQGHAASDNYFVALEEGEYTPFLAIGRFPVVEPAELDAIVDKTIRYVEESGVGPWRRKLLWISNEASYIQRTTDQLAAEQVARGFTGGKIYPLKSEKSNERHQERLLEAFSEGQLVVHFHGHGGRYIWRTGPTDYRKNRDLFNLDHLDMLEPSPRLPVVLSMTCFSAPFDHPLADSIGEKFLRLPDRGAIAVLAASWRNSPATAFSRTLVEELTKPQAVGEAVLRAKQEVKRRDMVETYNLLGDPAVPVAAPQSVLEVEVVADESGALDLTAVLPDPEAEFSGQAIVDWVDADGQVVASQQVPLDGPTLALAADELPTAQRVSVYFWDEATGVDGIGYYDWTSGGNPPEVETVAGAASR